MDNYDYLWNGKEHDWVLVKDPAVGDNFLIYNQRTHVLLHLDSPETKLMICNKMQENGAVILDKIPDGEPDIEDSDDDTGDFWS